MLDNNQPRVGGHEEALGRNQAVRDIARIFVQHRDCRNQLPNEAERRVDVQVERALVRHAQDVGEPGAFDVIGHDGQRRRRPHRTVHPPDAHVAGVPEVCEPRGALAQRELEGGHRRQLGTQPQDLQQLAGRAIRRDHAFAQAI